MVEGNFHEILLRFLFKNELSAEQAAQVSALAEPQVFEPGQVILTQGQPANSRLYFLLDGSVQILRSGEKIAKVSEAGEVLGEISLITGQPCGASSVAETRTSLLMIDLEKLKELPENLQSHFKSGLNRLFSVILAKKLTLTNEKARLFEITNRELQRAQKALENASEDKIGELSANQRKLLKTLDTVLRDELKTLRSEIDALKSLPAEKLGAVADTLTRKVDHLTHELEPFAEAFRKDYSLNGKRVLLAENELTEIINAKMSLGGTGVDLKVVSTLEEAQAAVAAEKFDIICVNEAFVDLLPYSKPHQPDAKFIFMSSKQISEHFQTLKQYKELSTIVARHPSDRLFTVKNTATTIRKLLSGDIFGADKYLNWGVELQEYKITHSGQRNDLIDKMEQYFQSMGISQTLRRKSITVADELLMNAIYDAPTDSKGKPLYNHLSRTVPVQLSPGEQGTFRFGCDGAFLAVSVEDPFGALQRATILNYLEKCFTTGVGGDAIEGKGGGGNGLFQLIQSSSLVVFNVRPGRKTEVIALLNVNVQMNRVSLFPSFHFFEAKD